jgi:DNA-binding GntR family transcriptional regulator
MTRTDSPLALRIEKFSDSLKQKLPIPQQVAQFIHDLIVSGELAPGDRIIESRLASRLGIGHPTVREALVALEHQGLVVRRANQGCVVTTLTHKEVEQILQVRAQLEVLAVELVTDSNSPERIEELHTSCREMKETAQSGDVEEFYRKDLQWHSTLWRLSDNPYLAKSLSQLMIPLLAFCMLKNLKEPGLVDMNKSAEGHEAITAAIASGDKTKAAQVAREKFAGFGKEHLSGFTPA